MAYLVTYQQPPKIAPQFVLSSEGTCISIIRLGIASDHYMVAAIRTMALISPLMVIVIELAAELLTSTQKVKETTPIQTFLKTI